VHSHVCGRGFRQGNKFSHPVIRFFPISKRKMSVASRPLTRNHSGVIDGSIPVDYTCSCGGTVKLVRGTNFECTKCHAPFTTCQRCNDSVVVGDHKICHFCDRRVCPECISTRLSAGQESTFTMCDDCLH